MKKLTWQRIIKFGILLILFAAALTPETSGGDVVGQDDFELFFPIFQNFQQTLYSTSYYMLTINEAFHYDLGCNLGTRDQILPDRQDSIVVLDFSYPMWEEEFGFGVDLFWNNGATLEELSKAVKSFALGYYNCSGSDHESQLVIGIGTNNKTTSIEHEQDTYYHGRAWAELVNSVNQWAIDQGIFHQVRAYGANDIEVSWSTPTWIRSWMKGYDSVNKYPLIHYGDAAGCPYYDTTATSCGNDWDLEDVWYVSWGAPPALPLPLIYRTDGINAKQWAHISQYSFENHGAPLGFTGVFTQYQACEQASSCDGIDNTPYAAYLQLYEELNKTPETAQELPWKTDIRWVEGIDFVAYLREAKAESTNTQPDLNHLETLQNSLDYALTDSTVSELMETSILEKTALIEHIQSNIILSAENPAPKQTTP